MEKWNFEKLFLKVNLIIEFRKIKFRKLEFGKIIFDNGISEISNFGDLFEDGNLFWKIKL